ncbi:Uncharacterized protein TCM_028229 [Theobroma cacao]|uniref:Uncharacterized protein n=1 Tax=Theobroma cacao TaxID=3641 RepID=A0A061GAM5_THECC|nr:Uncharacterized protein TCM_028229 [Theobroma cacao]
MVNKGSGWNLTCDSHLLCMMPSVKRLLWMMIGMPLVENTQGDAVHYNISPVEDYDTISGEIAPDNDFNILPVALVLSMICFSAD